MSTDTTYNGWTNYATWRINLEILDGTTVEDLGFEPQGEDRDDDERALADALEEHVDSFLEESGSGLVLDYARSFVSDVDWREIAEHLIDAWIEDHPTAYTPEADEDANEAEN
jgi:hypothetical protein